MNSRSIQDVINEAKSLSSTQATFWQPWPFFFTLATRKARERELVMESLEGISHTDPPFSLSVLDQLELFAIADT